MSDLPVVWVTNRAAGIVALVLLTMSMVAGLVLKTRPFGRLVRNISAIELHRALTIASLSAVAVHGLMLLMDKTITITWVDLLVPGTLPYKPVWTGIGVAAAEIMFVVAISYRFRRRLSMAVWRRLHYATYLVFALSLMHGIFAGSGTKTVWMQAIYIGSLAAVAGATAFRIISPTPPKSEIPEREARRPQPSGQVRPEPVAASQGSGGTTAPLVVRQVERRS
jgi:sulfoxide reductase heme-binding subunit YedZ